MIDGRQQRTIAATIEVARIRRLEECLNLAAREDVGSSPNEGFSSDSKHRAKVAQSPRLTHRSVVSERANRRQPHIAAACAVTATVLQMAQEGKDDFFV
jgi:hypothetical protein